MASKISPNRTGNKTVDVNFDLIASELNKLKDAINQPPKTSTTGEVTNPGDLRIVKGNDSKVYLELTTKEGVYSSFTDCFQPKPRSGEVPLELENLTVDNLFAKMFTIKQTQSMNGDIWMSGSSGVVESISGNSITFKDQDNIGVCSFYVDDLCIIEKVNPQNNQLSKKVSMKVLSVSGRTIMVQYYTDEKASVGDIVVQRGNTSISSRKKAIGFVTSGLSEPTSSNSTVAPTMYMYKDIDQFALPRPDLAIGNLRAINDVDFNTIGKDYIDDDGFYGQSVYLKGKFKIASNDDIIGLTIPEKSVYTSGDTFPLTPAESDWHYYTKNPSTNPYKKNTWYRYSGTAWVEYGLTGTYIDGSGIYTGTLVADQVVSGTFTGLTFKGFGNPALDGGPYIDTQRLSLYADDNDFYLDIWYDIIPMISWHSTDFGINLSLMPYQGTVNDGIVSSGAFKATTELIAGGENFIVGTSGNITTLGGKTVDTPSAGYLRYNGTKYVWDTPSFNMIYPSAGIAVSTGSAWGTSIVNNSTNWNTAYGWGNHASAGYLTSSSLNGYATQSWVSENYVTGESFGSLNTRVTGLELSSTNWNTAYTNTHTHANKTALDGISSTNISNWETAYTHSQSSHQSIINGTGFVKASGTTLSYDNSTYSLSSHTHNYNANLGITSIDATYFTNQSGELTFNSSVLSWSNISGKPTFATVATSGSYSDLSNKPTGFTGTKTWTDANSDDHTVTVSNGIITNWEIR